MGKIHENPPKRKPLVAIVALKAIENAWERCCQFVIPNSTERHVNGEIYTTILTEYKNIPARLEHFVRSWYVDKLVRTNDGASTSSRSFSYRETRRFIKDGDLTPYEGWNTVRNGNVSSLCVEELYSRAGELQTIVCVNIR